MSMHLAQFDIQSSRFFSYLLLSQHNCSPDISPF